MRSSTPTIFREETAERARGAAAQGMGAQACETCARKSFVHDKPRRSVSVLLFVPLLLCACYCLRLFVSVPAAASVSESDCLNTCLKVLLVAYNNERHVTHGAQPILLPTRKAEMHSAYLDHRRTDNCHGTCGAHPCLGLLEFGL